MSNGAERLRQRLDHGNQRIEEALERGEDVQAWESFWIDLLHLYEREWDCLPDADPPTAPAEPSQP